MEFGIKSHFISSKTNKRNITFNLWDTNFSAMDNYTDKSLANRSNQPSASNHIHNCLVHCQYTKHGIINCVTNQHVDTNYQKQPKHDTEHIAYPEMYVKYNGVIAVYIDLYCNMCTIHISWFRRMILQRHIWPNADFSFN